MSLSLLGEFSSLWQRVKARVKESQARVVRMELTPRQIAFVKSEMQAVEEDESRQPTARVEAGKIREVAETAITE